MCIVTSRRSGFTLIEILTVMALIGIVAGWMTARFTATRYKMDSNVRFLQNVLIGAQQTAIARNVPVQLMFDASVDNAHRVRILLDTDDDGQASESETVSYRPLSGAVFASPDSTLDGATPAYVTGAGLVSGRPALLQAVRIGPNGTLGGDVVLYIGSSQGATADLRALVITGATARTAFWSRQSGKWQLRSY